MWTRSVAHSRYAVSSWPDVRSAASCGLVLRQHGHHLPAVPHRGRLNVRAGQLPRMFLARSAFPLGGAGDERLGDERQPVGGDDATYRIGLQ